MSDLPCPECRAQGRSLPHVSADAHVDYFRCEKCGHVWTRPKPWMKRDRREDESTGQSLAVSTSAARRSRPVERQLSRAAEREQLMVRTAELRARYLSLTPRQLANRFALRQLRYELAAHTRELRRYRQHFMKKSS